MTREYFLLKDQKRDRDEEVGRVLLVFNAYKTRVLVMKEETKILDDKARISQVMISPEKRN